MTRYAPPNRFEHSVNNSNHSPSYHLIFVSVLLHDVTIRTREILSSSLLPFSGVRNPLLQQQDMTNRTKGKEIFESFPKNKALPIAGCNRFPYQFLFFENLSFLGGFLCGVMEKRLLLEASGIKMKSSLSFEYGAQLCTHAIPPAPA
ncbi:hypothetical protein NPIL_302721 [Nephila pilipes]|uniref:Uncharacterized protein n=1 Tax=Nephila pilipes TaxID=299642 RepID=A0A8X6NLB6_NEPPI|nr:hypothetical protein NPIL_139061 [Nephila pilipes]GFT21696.1 hypothetical protein NPIL_367391 [Nephila pilipes]GFU14634.1 hypothetical protein NPIL_663861 [Nephila pilipes]GFU27808.1 hypothetical protein NPIL_302721 [Nephila pilipes]